MFNYITPDALEIKSRPGYLILMKYAPELGNQITMDDFDICTVRIIVPGPRA
jgi:hypothetical protein